MATDDAAAFANCPVLGPLPADARRPGGDTDRMNCLNLRRRERQPLNYPSAGRCSSARGHFAGALIEEAGLR